MGMKRRRLALSCVDCRRRKVKCGREIPSCVRCVRGGNRDSCVYAQYDDNTNPGIPTPTDESLEDKREGSEGAQPWTEDADHWQRTSKAALSNAKASNSLKRYAPSRTMENLQEKVLELETYVNSGSRPHSAEKYLGMNHPARHGATNYKEAVQDFERSLLRGRSFKTQYFGPSHAASLLLQFEELSEFVKDILKRTPCFEKAKTDLKKVRREHQVASDANDGRDFREFAAMVPPKERTDVLVEQYLESLETTYRILHVPTFQQQYAQFWTNSDLSTVDFLVQLLLVTAAVNCVVPSDTDGFVGRSSVRRETATKWIEASEVWLGRHSHKHTTLWYYQTHILLVVAKKLTGYKIKREWTAAGGLLKLAMAAGLHREPTFLSSKICKFDQEMRRRLWFTIVELELTASCDRGMRASITSDDWDCLPPLNVHDEDFNESTQTMPSSKPLSEFTRTSFLCKAVLHLPLRLEILSDINSISGFLELHTVMGYDDRIRQILDDLPTWPDKPAANYPATLSKLLLHEFLLLLHQPFATQALAQSRFFTRCARRDSAITIMLTYNGDTLPLAQRLILSNCRNDSLRACLSTCHDIVVAASGRSDVMRDSDLSVDMITKTVDLFSTQVKSLGQGFHSYWITSSALGLVRSRISPQHPPEYWAQEAADRVLTLHNEIVTLQQPVYNGHVFMGKLHAHAVQHGLKQAEGQPSAAQSNASVDQSMLCDGFSPIDPFNDSVFDFDNFDIWNMGLTMNTFNAGGP